jgi:putative DNA primase/helicase
MTNGNCVSPTPADVIEFFKSAMQEYGVSPPNEIKADGQLHRFHIEGHKTGSTDGAYCLHLDGRPAGWFQDFKTGVKANWKLNQHYEPQWKPQKGSQNQRDLAASRDKKHQERALEAQRLWRQATPCNTHPYLERKGVPSHGLRIGPWVKYRKHDGQFFRDVIDGCLLVPLMDEEHFIWSLQAIFPHPLADSGRDKEFMTGCRKKGLFFPIGPDVEAETVYLAEGYATASSVFALTECRVYVAFDAGNLESVARTVRRLHPDAVIIMAGDNDCGTTGNPGLAAAKKAALAVGGRVSVPVFPDGRAGDWNDFHRGLQS